jgi:hypothetical protein
VDTERPNRVESEWGSVWRLLTIYAKKLANDMPAVFDGISQDDLVGETILEYLASESRLNWDPLLGSLAQFLCGVLKRKFLMHDRRSKRFEGSLGNDRHVLEFPRPAVSNGSTRIKITDGMRTVVRGDKELEDLVDAAQRVDDAARVNQQLSQLLQTTISDVVNRKKRLRRLWDRSSRGTEDSNLNRGARL